MYRIVEQLVSESDITFDDANHIVDVITSCLISKIPVLRQVIDDIFNDADPIMIKEHLIRMISDLQRDFMNEYKTWEMPKTNSIIRDTGCDQIL